MIRSLPILFTLWMLGSRSMADPSQAQLQAEVQQAFANMIHAQQINYQAKIQAPEVSAWLGDKLKARLGMPVKLDGYILISQDSQLAARPDLSQLPRLMQGMINGLIDQLSSQSHLMEIISNISTDLLSEFAYIISHKQEFDLISFTENTLDFEISGVDEPFMRGITTRAVRVRIDRKSQLPVMIRLTFPKGEFLEGETAYRTWEVPGESAPVFFPDSIQVRHNVSWINMPREFSLQFKSYTFSER